MEVPRLIENHTKHYLLETLRSCHDYRQNSYIFTWNIVIFVIFVVTFGFGLYLCAYRKRKEKEKSPQKDQEYILNKIKEMREIDNYQTQMKMMTKLPISSEYENKRLPEHSSGFAY